MWIVWALENNGGRIENLSILIDNHKFVMVFWVLFTEAAIKGDRLNVLSYA
jgi:hypothetical protein